MTYFDVRYAYKISFILYSMLSGSLAALSVCVCVRVWVCDLIVGVLMSHFHSVKTLKKQQQTSHLTVVPPHGSCFSKVPTATRNRRSGWSHKTG